jgi:hypothetical protein
MVHARAERSNPIVVQMCSGRGHRRACRQVLSPKQAPAPSAMGGRRQVIAVTRGEMIYPVEAGKTDEN